MKGLVQVLEAYLMGSKSFGEFAEWLAGIDWDDPQLTKDQKEDLAFFELLLTEVAEGLREERELWKVAADFVSTRSERAFAMQSFREVSIISGTADSSSLPQVEVVPTGQESQSWSISPQGVLS